MTPPTLSPPPQHKAASSVLHEFSPATGPKKKGRGHWLLLAIALFAIVADVMLYQHHKRAEAAARVPTVAIATVDREDLVEDLWLSAEFHPYQEVSLHSKVTGYLKSIGVDYGDHVKAGQKIAELEVPELEDELAKSKSAYQASLQDVNRAKADFTQADLIFQRLQGVSKDHPKLVAQQELDDARAKRDGMNATLGAAQQRVDESQSEINRTKTLFDYTTITVPFEGIITHRYVDAGALIQAGTSSSVQAGTSSTSQSLPLVDVAEQDMLRLVFPVPESAVPTIHDGAPVEISVSALNEQFQGKIARFAGKVDRDTRTMHTEVDVPNPDGKYTPGMYAFVRLILQESKNSLSVPILAIAGGDTPTVSVVNKNGIIEERAVKLGLQTPDKVEIREGVAEGEQVIVGRHNGARPGQKVTVKLMAPVKSTPSAP